MAHDREALLSRMTLEQKCALLSGGSSFSTRAYPELGIPRLQFSDGPHGLRHQDEGANHLGAGVSLPATCFPPAVTMSQTWDVALAERVGEALGQEAASMGVNVVLGPGLCIKRSPLCGRNFEYFSEDPLVSGKMAAGVVSGIQATGIGACLKHFAANSQETRRQASDSVVDERTLREIYLAGFETAVRESRPATIMSSYNRVNGVYANENEWLLGDVLRDEWGFQGAVVSDWGASNDHVRGVAAGSTFEMPAPDLSSVRELVRAVRTGALAIEAVDARVREALDLIFSTDEAKRNSPATFDVEAHHALAREVAAKGVVLLKNEGALLPLRPGTRVALIGDFAQTPRYQGAGSSLVNPTRLENLLDELREEEGLELVGFEPGFERAGGECAEKAAAAVALAAEADVALVCLGLDEGRESEGVDRTDLRIGDDQIALLHRVAAVNPRVVVVLNAGGCVETPWSSDCQALVYAALGGQAGAGGLLDVLTGRQNPQGRLTESWPQRLEDTPTAGAFPSDEATAEYREGLYVGYRYYQTAGVPVAFPFGFGLSYTSFSYSDVRATPEGVSFVVTNTGDVTGVEVAQVYVSKPDARVFRPARTLVGWSLVELAPGESREVQVPLTSRAFAYFDVVTGHWEIEGGSYELLVGASVDDLRLSACVELEGTGAEDPYAQRDVGPYRSGKIRQVSDAQFAALLGVPLPSPRLVLDENLTFRDLRRTRSPLLCAVGSTVEGVYHHLLRQGRPSEIAFVYNMPLRAIPKLGGPLGPLSRKALVFEARGGWVVGAALAALSWRTTGKARGWLVLACPAVAVAGALVNAAENAAFSRRHGLS